MVIIVLRCDKNGDGKLSEDEVKEVKTRILKHQLITSIRSLYLLQYFVAYLPVAPHILHVINEYQIIDVFTEI